VKHKHQNSFATKTSYIFQKWHLSPQRFQQNLHNRLLHLTQVFHFQITKKYKTVDFSQKIHITHIHMSSYKYIINSQNYYK